MVSERSRDVLSPVEPATKISCARRVGGCAREALALSEETGERRLKTLKLGRIFDG
jgi:hypothetical protein